MIIVFLVMAGAGLGLYALLKPAAPYGTVEVKEDLFAELMVSQVQPENTLRSERPFATSSSDKE